MKVEDNVVKVLKESTITVDRLVLPARQLDRAEYVAVNKVIEILGGKWDRKTKAHIFTQDPRPKVAEMLGTGDVQKEQVHIVDPKKEFQFFETPYELAKRMAMMANIEEGMSVLEPSAGRGRIADACRVFTPEIYVCEIQTDLQADLKARYKWVTEDFLSYTGEMRFDRIVMNPPFTKGQDIAHIRHAFNLLKPEGRLVALSSPGWTFNKTKKFTEFRDWFEGDSEWFRGRSTEELPKGTFKESGTNIKTLLLTIEKPE